MILRMVLVFEKIYVEMIYNWAIFCLLYVSFYTILAKFCEILCKLSFFLLGLFLILLNQHLLDGLIADDLDALDCDHHQPANQL